MQKVAPWLTIDSKTYPVVDSRNGHIAWIVDGYTTLADYPYAEPQSLAGATIDQNTQTQAPGERTQPDRKVSYIRNSVKAIVDAYDGTVTLYAQDETDPVLKAWSKVFPGTVQPKSAMPTELRDHLRYPENLFNIQRSVLTRYHVTSPANFFTSSELWQLADGPRATSDATSSGVQPPYYSVASGPEGQPYFQLSSVLQVNRQPYLAAQLSVSSAPDTYGEITLRTVNAAQRVPGPAQAAGLINAAPPVTADKANITAINPIYGNLLSIPLVNGGMAYVWPMYARTGADDMPKLFRVLALNSTGSGVGYAPTVEAALTQAGFRNVQAALGDAGTGVTGDGSVPAPATNPVPANTNPVPADAGATDTEATRRQAVGTAWTEVLNAQKSGDQERIGRAMAALQTAIDALVAPN